MNENKPSSVLSKREILFSIYISTLDIKILSLKAELHTLKFS